MGAINNDGMHFIGELGRRITHSTDGRRESAFVFQQLYFFQRYNTVAVLGTFTYTTVEDETNKTANINVQNRSLYAS